MSNKNSDQNDSVIESRADTLINDYLDEMFSSSSPTETHQSEIHEGAAKEKASPESTPEEVSDTFGSQQELEGEVLDQDPKCHEKTDLPTRFQHPNLKPASAILAARNSPDSKPFKSQDDKQDAVLAGLMPKFAPVEPEQETPVGTLEARVEEKTELVQEVQAESVTATIVESHTEAAKATETAEVKEEQLTQELVVNPQVAQDVAQQRTEEAESQIPEQSTQLEEPPAAAPPLKTSQFRELPEFEMLLFDVRGLQLAVPLISLGSIHRLEEEFTPIVGRADWYLGMYRVNDRNLQVVDTARWVMPSRMQADSDQPYEFVIRLADTNWALACTGVQQAMRISKEEVKWRTQQGKRPWLAGTVISKMCALLDVESMARLLDENKLEQSV